MAKTSLEKYKRDFPLFCKEQLRIQDRSGKAIPFVLNRAQKHIWSVIADQINEGKPVRLYILKARQQGVSTFVTALYYWITSLNANRVSYVVAHDKPSARNIYNKLKFYYRHVDPAYRPEQKINNRQELVFAKSRVGRREKDTGLNSRVSVDTARNKHMGASYTVQAVLFSEFARYPEVNPEIIEALATFQASIPFEPWTFVIYETTARGPGYGRTLWTENNGLTKIFLPWIVEDSYRLDEPLSYSELMGYKDSPYGNEVEVFKEVKKLLRIWYPELCEGVTTEEANRRLHKEALHRMAWRRKGIRVNSNGDISLFKENYPLNPEEAFRMSGGSAFNVEVLDERRHVVEDIVPSMQAFSEESNDFESAQHGSLRIYEDPIRYENYAIGADPAGGYKDSDYSAAQVLRVSPEGYKQVAVLQGKFPPYPFARRLKALALRYNVAQIIVETTGGYGIAVVDALIEGFGYGNLWRRKADATYDKNESQRYGFSMNRHTKPAVISSMRQALQDGDLLLYDDETLLECAAYRRLEDDKFEAPYGKHDDLVTSMAMALRLASELPSGSSPARDRRWTDPNNPLNWMWDSALQRGDVGTAKALKRWFG